MNATIIKSALCKTRVHPRPSPTLFFFPGLSSTSPIIPPQTLPFAETLASMTPVILQEYHALRQAMEARRTQSSPHPLPSSPPSSSSDYNAPGEHKLHAGHWEWHSFIDKGIVNPDFVSHCPETVNDCYEHSVSTTHMKTVWSSSSTSGREPTSCSSSSSSSFFFFFFFFFFVSFLSCFLLSLVLTLFCMLSRHPELTLEEIKALIEMFGYAKQKVIFVSFS